MADFSKFRSSIGGFHRGDVADYIESLAIAHKKELRSLTDANEKLLAERNAMAEELAHTKGELDGANAELKRLQEEDASLQQQVESLAQEAAELSQRAQQAEEALRDAQRAVCDEDDGEEEPAACDEDDADSFENLPEKELEAYRRAEAMERNALLRAERLRSKLSQLCEGARTRYTDSGEELGALADDLSSVLERMRDTVAELRLAFDETQEAFDELQMLDAE